MTRIFLSLAVTSSVLLVIAFILGLNIGDPTSRDAATQSLVQYHFLSSLSGILFAMLVHSIVLTYFMGTGRWLEETGNAYRLSAHWRKENQTLKYRTIPAMVGCVFLLIVTGAVGASADPASPVDFGTWGGLSAATVHFLLAMLTVAANVIVHILEFQAIHRNGELIDEVVGEVRRIREERGLAV